MGKNKGVEMIAFTFRLPKDLLEQLRDKSGTISVSAIIRRLIEKYLRGEVGLD